jgi:hypothetical protein
MGSSWRHKDSGSFSSDHSLGNDSLIGNLALGKVERGQTERYAGRGSARASET